MDSLPVLAALVGYQSRPVGTKVPVRVVAVPRRPKLLLLRPWVQTDVKLLPRHGDGSFVRVLQLSRRVHVVRLVRHLLHG